MNKYIKLGILVFLIILLYIAIFFIEKNQLKEESVSENIELKYVPVMKTVTEPQEQEVKYLSLDLEPEIQDYIFEECEKYNISPFMIMAICELESKCDAHAVGDSGKSLGLMQIQKKWWKSLMQDIGTEDLLDPYENIDTGIAIIRYLRHLNDDVAWVLTAYNAGQNTANEYADRLEMSSYAQKVMELERQLEEEYGY